MFFRWAQQQSKRIDVMCEILYNSSTKIKTIKHNNRSMAPRIPSNCSVNVKPSLSYNVGDVVAARLPNSEKLQLLRVIASPGTDMIDDGEPPREITLERGNYWLETDINVDVTAKDSRFFGPFHTNDIVGRAYNMEFGGQLYPVMHNSEQAVEQDSRNAWTLPYLVKDVRDFIDLFQASENPEWVQEQLKARVRCKVLSLPAANGVAQQGEAADMVVPNL